MAKHAVFLLLYFICHNSFVKSSTSHKLVACLKIFKFVSKFDIVLHDFLDSCKHLFTTDRSLMTEQRSGPLKSSLVYGVTYSDRHQCPRNSCITNIPTPAGVTVHGSCVLRGSCIAADWKDSQYLFTDLQP